MEQNVSASSLSAFASSIQPEAPFAYYKTTGLYITFGSTSSWKSRITIIFTDKNIYYPSQAVSSQGNRVLTAPASRRNSLDSPTLDLPACESVSTNYRGCCSHCTGSGWHRTQEMHVWSTLQKQEVWRLHTWTYEAFVISSINFALNWLKTARLTCSQYLLLNRSSYHWAMYKKLRINYVDKEVQACKSHYYKQSIEESKGDVSKVWKAINEASLWKTASLPSSIIVNGVQYREPRPVASALNTHFVSTGKILADKLTSVYSTIIPTTGVSSPHSFHLKPVTGKFVSKQLRCLKANKAIGLDQCTCTQGLGWHNCFVSDEAAEHVNSYPQLSQDLEVCKSNCPIQVRW